MDEANAYSYNSNQGDVQMKVVDMEEKQRLMRERVLLLGKNFIDDRSKTLNEIQELKKITLTLQEEVLRMKEFSQRLAEQIDKTARKEELMIIQRQLDLLRK